MAISIDIEPLRREMQDMALRMQQRIVDVFVETVRANASRRTGELAESVTDNPPLVEPDGITTLVEVRAEYGIYQDQGTGIYGPEGVPIRPVRAKFLVFDWPAAGGIVFAKKVRGSEPTRFWSKAVDDYPQIVRRVEAGG